MIISWLITSPWGYTHIVKVYFHQPVLCLCLLVRYPFTLSPLTLLPSYMHRILCRGQWIRYILHRENSWRQNANPALFKSRVYVLSAWRRIHLTIHAVSKEHSWPSRNASSYRCFPWIHPCFSGDNTVPVGTALHLEQTAWQPVGTFLVSLGSGIHSHHVSWLVFLNVGNLRDSRFLKRHK